MMTMRLPVWARAVALGGALATSGCAFSDLRVSPPPGPMGATSGAGARRAVFVAGLVDRRPNGPRCGMQKNMYNMDTANVHCTEDPAVAMTRLLITELAAGGFVVNQGTPGPESVILEGALLQFFVEPKVGVFTFTPEADIHIALHARTASGLAADRSFYVKGEETSMAGLESNFQKAAEAATRHIVLDMAGAVLSLFDRFPGLGDALPPPDAWHLPAQERRPS